MRPNVVLIVLDAARADALEPYGAPAGASPAIADLAGRGAALPAAFATTCWTVPSHAALFTGLLPRATGLMQAPGGTPNGCRPVIESHRDRLLPEVLRRSGYRTLGVSTNLWLTPASGFATGFDEFITVEAERQTPLHRRSPRARLRWAVAGIRARSDDGAREAGRRLRGWLERRRDQPFFAFVNLVECHSPYLPPRPYNDLGPLDRLRAAEEARRHLTLDAIWRACAGGFDVPDEALERMRHLYRRSIRLLDDWIAALLETLDRRGLLEETLVVVTSDHGENLGESGLMGHAFSLDDRLIRVPCVVAGPGAFAPREARSLAALPELIAEAAGLEHHPWGNGLPPPGVAVAQFDPPAPREDPRVAAAISRWGLDPEAAERIAAPLSCATDGRRKLLRRGDREELYDLDADPLESSPTSPDETGANDRLHRLRWALAHADAQAAPEPAAAHRQPSAEELRDLEDRMRTLGYL